MNSVILYVLAGVILICMGMFGIVVVENLVRKILAVNIMSTGVFLLLIAFARRSEDPFPDPVPHAMVLTGIVVSVSATAVALSLVYRLKASSGRDELTND